MEARIAEQLGISRGPLREAFKVLPPEGLLIDVRNRGTFVVRLTPTDVRDIFDLARPLSPAPPRLSLNEPVGEDVCELRGLSHRLEAAAESGDVRAFARVDFAFHEAVCRLSGNRRFHAVFARDVPTMQALIQDRRPALPLASRYGTGASAPAGGDRDRRPRGGDGRLRASRRACARSRNGVHRGTAGSRDPAGGAGRRA